MPCPFRVLLETGLELPYSTCEYNGNTLATIAMLDVNREGLFCFPLNRTSERLCTHGDAVHPPQSQPSRGVLFSNK